MVWLIWKPITLSSGTCVCLNDPQLRHAAARCPSKLKRMGLAGRATNRNLVRMCFQNHAQSGVVFIAQSDEPKGLQASRRCLTPSRHQLGYALNDCLCLSETVPTENLISAKKVKEGSCGKRITWFAGP